MNILFLIFHGFDPSSGITKKIYNQVDGLRQLGHEVHLCSYGFDSRGHRVRWVDDEVIADYGRGAMAAIRSRLGLDAVTRWCQSHAIDVVYARSFHNASPQTVGFFRSLQQAGIRTALEIPTYPYDQEYVGFPLLTRMKLHIDQLFRRSLAQQVNAIVTFSDDDFIFGQRTIRISNGVNFDAIPLVCRKQEDRPAESSAPTSSTPLHFTAVAEVHYWHGLDRLISGLGEYYASNPSREVIFNIVGGVGPSEMHDSSHAPGFAELMDRWNIRDKVVFHGQQFGQPLTDIFNHTDLCIGSLGRHRSGIQHIKTLKNREYAARGIPFVYSETDSDFDDKPYIYKVPADESPIDITALVAFVEHLDMRPEDIRASIEPLSWREQMRRVIDHL